MTIDKVLSKYGVPADAKGTCGAQNLQEKFVSYVAQPQFVKEIQPNKNAYVLVTPNLFDKVTKIEGNRYFQVANAVAAFLEIHNTFHKDVKSLSTGSNHPRTGKDCEIDPTARFGENVVLGNRVKIHPYVIVGSDVQIGDDSEVFSHSVIYDRTRLGKRNLIDSNASIGGDGYRIIRDDEGINHRMIHIGGVRFGDDVEFGNSSCVDRGTFGDTVLENHVKIDNMVHIGHNVHVKENAQLAASSCIGGSTIIGKNCWVGIGATLSNGLVIGDNASVLINAIVVRDVGDDETVAGFYAMQNTAWRLVVKDHTKQYEMKVRKSKKDSE